MFCAPCGARWCSTVHPRDRLSFLSPTVVSIQPAAMEGVPERVVRDYIDVERGPRVQDYANREESPRPSCGLDSQACSIMWTPIQPLTCCCPFVGHMGITDSSGRLHDWGGGMVDPCTPSDMLFGKPARYIRLHPIDMAAFDAAIEQADREVCAKAQATP